VPARFSPAQKRTIASLSAAVAIRMLGIFLVLPVFTLYGEQFTSSKPLIGLAFGAYGLSNALLQIPFGWLSDRFGRKPLLLVGLALHSVGSILAAVPGNIAVLIAARLIQGAGAISSVAFALVADSVDEGSRATAMAFLGIPIGLSFAGGVLAGPAIASVAGYASLFWLSGILSLLALLFLAMAVKEPDRGAAASPAAGHRLPVTSILAIGDVLKLNLCGFLMSFFMSSFFFQFPLLARRHLPLHGYYRILVPMLLAGGIAMFGASGAADRGWAKASGLAAFATLSASALLLLRSAEWGFQHRPLLALVIAGILFFVGFSSLEPILPTLITRAAPRAAYGTALGTYSTLQFLGSFAGGAAAGVLVNAGDQFLLASLLLAAGFGVMLMARVRAA
jgi:MFS family permease